MRLLDRRSIGDVDFEDADPLRSVAGRDGLQTTLTNVSEVTGEREAVNVSTVQLRDGSVLFLIGVAPQSEARTYLNTFSRVRQSLQLADGERR